MYALVDGNNFYVSCERVFRPDLIGLPVVVLGMDNDTHDKDGVPIPFEKRPGETMAKQIQALAPERPMVRETPLTKDWNDDLVLCSRTPRQAGTGAAL